MATPGSSAMGSMTTCAVCLGRVSTSLLSHHMNGHSKDEVVAALLLRQERPQQQQQQPPQQQLHPQPMDGIHFLANVPHSEYNHQSRAMSRPFANAVGPVTSSHQQSMMSPILMPQMMVMSSPCLIPQPNGPPILVNVPSYVYPNMMLNSMPQPSSHPSPVLIPNLAVGSLPPTTSMSLPYFRDAVVRPPASAESRPNKDQAHSETVTSGGGSRDMSIEDNSSDTILSSSSSEDPSSINSSLRSEEQFVETKLEAKDEEEEEEESSQQSALQKRSIIKSPVPGPSRAPPPPYPTELIAKSPLRRKNEKKDVNTMAKSSRVNKVQDTLLSETSSTETNPLLASSAPVASSKNASETSTGTSAGDGGGGEGSGHKSSKEVYGFTQYAEDSPYPAASLNFSSMLLEPQVPVKTQTETNIIKPSLGANINDDGNVYTVQTVSDLQNILKSDDDIQIVVPNELLETSEFKTFISTLNSFPLHDYSFPSSSGDQNPGISAGGSGKSCNAPPNTPNTTRPPSVSAEVRSYQLSPQPGTSREVTRSGFEVTKFEPDEESVLPESLNQESEEDITLQDLVAMETMEEADVDEDDQFFTLSNGTNPLEPFMNAILQVPDASSLFTCEKCGLHFGSLLEFRNHRDMCLLAMGKGKKGSKSTPKSKVKKPQEMSNKVGETPPTESSFTEVKPEIKAEIKSEIMDSSSQPVLAATGQNWKCNQCKVVFETGPQLLEHLDLMRSSDHKCTHCHIIFDDRKTLLLHRRKFHQSVPRIKVEQQQHTGPKDVMPNENGEYVCDKCDRAFREKDLLFKHMTCHDEDRPFECLECGKKFTKAGLLRDHRRRHFEVGAFECTYCQKRFYTPNKLREHVRVHTGEAPLACNICGKNFKRHSNLSEHKRTHLENRPVKPPKELFCHCGKVFRTQRDLDWHKEGEHDKLPKKCNFCGEVFVHGSSLTRHVRLKHESNFLPENKKSSLYAKCPLCFQMFYKTSINKHIRIKHQGQKAFQCDVCKVSFVTKCNLQNHQWQHKGNRARPFKCQLCNKAYLRQSLLDGHMRSHRGIKPFVCNECGVQFANKSNWQRHVSEHEGTRNFECPHCQKRFSRGYYLTDHLKVHTGEKPYVCGICGKMAATRSNYNSHLRTHITREPVNSEV